MASEKFKTINDLEGFSKELQEAVKEILARRGSIRSSNWILNSSRKYFYRLYHLNLKKVHHDSTK